MAQANDPRITNLRKRRGHRVAHRLIDTLVAKRSSYSHIVTVLDCVAALMAECRRRRSHGALPLTFVRGLLPHKRTFDRYMSLLTGQSDGAGGHDFYIVGETLHIAGLYHRHDEMVAAEAQFAATRERRRLAQKARRARHRRQRDPHRMAQNLPSEAICEVKPPLLSSIEDRNPDTQDIDLSRIEALWQAEQDAEVSGVGSNEPPMRELTSLEVTERALAEERALRPAIRVEAAATLPRLTAAPDQLAAWGWSDAKVRHHRFTEGELIRAVDKVSRAKTFIGNKAGCVAATILRWRRGEWMIGRAA